MVRPTCQIKKQIKGEALLEALLCGIVFFLCVIFATKTMHLAKNKTVKSDRIGHWRSNERSQKTATQY